MSVFTCKQAEFSAVKALVVDSAAATTICSTYDVSNEGAQAAVLRYLATSRVQNINSVNVSFILFSR